jgi:hypothetical protein
MEANSRDLKMEARTYFLQQGQSIGKLHEVLSSDILSHYIGKWFSAVIETVLYFLFLIAIVCAFIFPTEIKTKVATVGQTTMSASVQDARVTEAIFVFKLVIIVIALPFPAFAILLGRNRRKNTLIRKAFEETKKMKSAFDAAVKELNL